MSKLTGFPWQRALAEFLVIFAGITLSLAADDWWQSRADHAREATALNEVLSDLSDDADAITLKTTMGREWDQAALWVLRHRGRADIPPDSAAAAILPLFRTYRYQPVRSAYVGLRSTGDLALVRDENLRRLIVDYYEQRQSYEKEFDGTGQSISLSFIDASRGLVLWTAENPAATSIRGQDSGAGFKLLQPWPAVSENPEFLHAATWLGLHGATVILRFSDALAENAAVRSAISEYLAEGR